MNSKMAFPIATFIVCLSLLATGPANAQSPVGSTPNDEVSQHHQLQYQMMKNMTDEMTRMTEQMSQTSLTSDQSKEMAERMASMSTMMRRMSGLEARPAHTHAQLQDQMNQMRKLMDDMMRDSRMSPSTK